MKRALEHERYLHAKRHVVKRDRFKAIEGRLLEIKPTKKPVALTEGLKNFIKDIIYQKGIKQLRP